MALMIRMLITDSRSSRRETLTVLLEYYVQLQDFETKVFLESAAEKTSFDQATVKELAGLSKDYPVWQSPGAMRLHPMSPRALEAWRELWVTICRVTLHRDVDLVELEERIENLPCTSLQHFTKRQKGVPLEDALYKLMRIWEEAERDCSNAGASYLMPHKLKRLDSLASAMSTSAKMTYSINDYLRRKARNHKGVRRQDMESSDIIDAIFYAEQEQKPSLCMDLLVKSNAPPDKKNSPVKGGDRTGDSKGDRHGKESDESPKDGGKLSGRPDASFRGRTTPFEYKADLCAHCGSKDHRDASRCMLENRCMYCGWLASHQSQDCHKYKRMMGLPVPDKPAPNAF